MNILNKCWWRKQSRLDVKLAELTFSFMGKECVGIRSQNRKLTPTEASMKISQHPGERLSYEIVLKWSSERQLPEMPNA